MDAYKPTPVSREIVESLIDFDLGPTYRPWWDAYVLEHESADPEHWQHFRFPQQAIRDFEGYVLGRVLQMIDFMRSMHPTPEARRDPWADEPSSF
jgi:hypothetical protein